MHGARKLAFGVSYKVIPRTQYKRTGHWLCCRGFILALFQSTTANKIDSEHTQDYKRLLPVCKAEILRVIVKRIEVVSSFLLISDDFRLKVPKIAK